MSGLVLVNGSHSSVQGPRARALFGGSAEIVYKEKGRVGSTPTLARAVRESRASWIYCIDLGVPGAPIAAFLRRPGTRLIYEIGDPSAILFENQGRSGWEVWLARLLETNLPARADALVFRGSYLLELFRSEASSRGKALPRSYFVPDGVDTQAVRPARSSERVEKLRRALGLEGMFVVGVVGSLHHNRRTGSCYGLELVEAIALLPDAANVRGLVVGDGPGLQVLRERIEALGLTRRVLLAGRVPHPEICDWLNVLDVGISTQTDDAVGWGRTTAKLPEYLAAGVVVVSTDVGEAHRLLGSSLQTLPFHGTVDEEYPARLAGRIAELQRVDLDNLRKSNRLLALQHFDYRVLRERVSQVIGIPGAPADGLSEPVDG
jgi:glycosyltransferase involved in cell wall biosynthesis